MKNTLIFAVLLASSLSSHASGLYCKNRKTGSITNLLKFPEDAHDFACQTLLAEGSQSFLCFTGARKATIEAINDKTINLGDDGQRLLNAWYKGKNEIQYQYEDVVSDFTEDLTIKRCTRKFFKM